MTYAIEAARRAAALAAPALDCRARGGEPYWRRAWWQRYGEFVCEVRNG